MGREDYKEATEFKVFTSRRVYLTYNFVPYVGKQDFYPTKSLAFHLFTN